MSAQELQNLVVPVALYPDALLSQMLVASTYPTEVFEAGQFLQQNQYLRGRDLMEAAQEQNWDPSVQALVAFPDVLARMNRSLSWTTELGNAFLAQQADVMDAIQELRAEARESGQLQSGPQLRVNVETQGDESAIEIQPADPQRIYVPNYDPYVVWGAPVAGAYPALPYASGCGFGAVFSTVANLAGLLPGFAGFLGPRSWGWALSWLADTLFVNNGFFSDFGFHNWNGGYRGSSVWAHDSRHRLGVPYGNRSLARRYGERQGSWRNAGSQARSGSGGRSIAPYRSGNESFSRGNYRRGFAGSEQAAPRERMNGLQSYRGTGRDNYARSEYGAGRPFTGSRTSGGYAGFGSTPRGLEGYRSANRFEGEAGVPASRMSSERGSSFNRGSSFRHESSRRVRSASSRGSSHSFKQPKQPKMKAPHYAKVHGGGHSSGGHGGGKRSHRG